MLGDSLRRRGVQTRPDRPSSKRPAGQRRFRWWHWVLTALGVVLLAFVTGYLLSVLVLFPAPETARSGIPVPDLRGMTRIEARGVLTEAGLEVGRVLEMPSMDVEDGRVLAQDPIAEQQLRSGAGVDITLSGGPPEIRVPPVAGLGSATARDLLEQSGFDVEIQPITANLPEGTVTRLVPAAGSELRLPAVVTLFVSIGPPPMVDSLPGAPVQPRGDVGSSDGSNQEGPG